MQVQSLDREDPLKEEMATHSSILAMENPMNRGDLPAIVHGVAKSETRLSDRHGQIHKRRHYLQIRKNDHLLQEETGIAMGVDRDYQDNYLIFFLPLEFGKLSHSRWL